MKIINKLIGLVWLTDVSYLNGEFKGVMSNDPGFVVSFRFGQEWTISKSEISDWMFMREGKIYGNYTLRPPIRTKPEEEEERLNY